MGQMVDLELDLIAIFADPSIYGHDSGIADQNIKPRGFGQETLRNSLDGSKAGEITLHKGDGGIGDLLADVVNESIGVGGASASEVDVGRPVLH